MSSTEYVTPGGPDSTPDGIEDEEHYEKEIAAAKLLELLTSMGFQFSYAQVALICFLHPCDHTICSERWRMWIPRLPTQPSSYSTGLKRTPTQMKKKKQ